VTIACSPIPWPGSFLDIAESILAEGNFVADEESW
jgi:hypothetical protein